MHPILAPDALILAAKRALASINADILVKTMPIVLILMTVVISASVVLAKIRTIIMLLVSAITPVTLILGVVIRKDRAFIAVSFYFTPATLITREDSFF